MTLTADEPSRHGPDCHPVVVIVVDLFLSTGSCLSIESVLLMIAEPPGD